jgi:hypothetical protein
VPTDGEWKSAEKVSKILEAFLEATNLFSGNLYHTQLYSKSSYKYKKRKRSTKADIGGSNKKRFEGIEYIQRACFR